MRTLDLFSGIGGWALAASWVWGKDHSPEAFVEIDPFCRKVLRKHWPEVPIFEDIRTFHYEGEQIDLLTASPPCQSASCAGKRRGTSDDRWLWGEAFRILSETKPEWAIFENVRGLLTLERGVVFEGLLAELEALNYETRGFVIPAVGVGAPHKRDRVWVVAHTKSIGWGTRGTEPAGQQRQSINGGIGSAFAPDTISEGLQGWVREPPLRHLGFSGGSGSDERQDWKEDWTSVAARTCGVDDGIPRRVDRSKRIKALGNSIVPRVAACIMKAIKDTKNLMDEDFMQ